MRTVAALFVLKNGPYFGVEGVEPYDETRDAFGYTGPHPVVTHPPCQLWGNFAFVNYKRWGGEHNRPGNDGGAFAHALLCVRKYSGVLEHPAFSRAWLVHGLQRPKGEWEQTADGAWVCEVWQSAYGHKCRKRTWLYYVGNPPIALDWRRLPGTHQIGFHDQRGPDRNKPTISGREASATPETFKHVLIELARNA